jgi:hypothetical protein
LEPLPLLLPIENRFRTLSGLNGCEENLILAVNSSTPDEVGLPLLDRNLFRSDSPRLKVCRNRTATLSGGEPTTTQAGSFEGEVGGVVVVAVAVASSTGLIFLLYLFIYYFIFIFDEKNRIPHEIIIDRHQTKKKTLKTKFVFVNKIHEKNKQKTAIRYQHNNFFVVVALQSHLV